MPNHVIFSPCRRYRYALWRSWDERLPTLCFIGLNPSTANGLDDDPTVKKCISFAKKFGFGGISMANLFAYCSTSPSQLSMVEDPVGPNNDSWIKTLYFDADVTIAAWGNHGKHLNRENEITESLPQLYCLAKNQNGQPAHPLYLPTNSTLKLYQSNHTANAMIIANRQAG